MFLWALERKPKNLKLKELNKKLIAKLEYTHLSKNIWFHFGGNTQYSPLCIRYINDFSKEASLFDELYNLEKKYYSLDYFNNFKTLSKENEEQKHLFLFFNKITSAIEWKNLNQIWFVFY